METISCVIAFPSACPAQPKLHRAVLPAPTCPCSGRGQRAKHFVSLLDQSGCECDYGPTTGRVSPFPTGEPSSSRSPPGLTPWHLGAGIRSGAVFFSWPGCVTLYHLTLPPLSSSSSSWSLTTAEKQCHELERVCTEARASVEAEVFAPSLLHEDISKLLAKRPNPVPSHCHRVRRGSSGAKRQGSCVGCLKQCKGGMAGGTGESICLNPTKHSLLTRTLEVILPAGQVWEFNII